MKTEIGLTELLLDDQDPVYRDYKPESPSGRGEGFAFLGSAPLKRKVLNNLEALRWKHIHPVYPALASAGVTGDEIKVMDLEDRDAACREKMGIPYEILKFTPPDFSQPDSDAAGAIIQILEALNPGSEVPSLPREVDIHRIDQLHKIAETKVEGPDRTWYVEHLLEIRSDLDGISQNETAYQKWCQVLIERIQSRNVGEQLSRAAYQILRSSYYRQNTDDVYSDPDFLQVPAVLNWPSREGRFQAEAEAVVEAFRRGGTPLRLGA